MQIHKIINPIVKDAVENYIKAVGTLPYAYTEGTLSLAIGSALEKHVEIFNSECIIDHHAIRHGGEDYISYQEEKRGYEIGKAINNKDNICITKKEEIYRGVKISKTCVLLKLDGK